MKILILLVASLLLGACDQVVERPARSDRFVVTRFGVLTTIQDTRTGRCWLRTSGGGIIEVDREVCE